ncbi:hypothetical protein [Streptomyces sp. H39-C1]|uniref:hypothetical protein n=1 Tax=Streptomyces sp. H39-C1 TaxID=3004355 RepID=UPI0022B02528|nr:hypothetical protein [Streptomyces sp. H39-C1]MCZ4099832.1 hypothetical protein [Streptomyces sp. H39-C1]
MRASVSHIAAGLAAATGNEVTRTDLPSGSVRLEVEIPGDISPTARYAVLLALADADSYGHGRSQDAQRVWAIINTEGNP